MNDAFWERIRTLPLRWKLLGGLFLVLLFSAALGGESPGLVPPGVEPGAVLAGIQLPGEQPLYHEQGLHVVDVEGPWVALRFGLEQKSVRWFNFRHVAGCMPAPE